MKSIIITVLFVFIQQIVFAQDADKTVAITVSGSGKTLEDAKQAALRSAMEIGDTEAAVAAQRKMTQLAVDADRAAQAKSANERRQKQAQAQPMAQGGQPQAPARPDPKAAFVRLPPVRSHGAALDHGHSLYAGHRGLV